MIDSNYVFQLSLFGSFKEISPTPDTLQYFISSLSSKVMIPVTNQEATPEGLVARITMKTIDESLVIYFGINRIDIKREFVSLGIYDPKNIGLFLDEVKSIIKIVNNKFPKKFNRLGFIANYFVRPLTKSEFADVFEKVINPTQFYKGKEITEWVSRFVTKSSNTISASSESLNAITEISRITGNVKFGTKIENLDRVLVSLDINTHQSLNEFRFDLKSVSDFTGICVKMQKKLLDDVIKLITI